MPVKIPQNTNTVIGCSIRRGHDERYILGTLRQLGGKNEHGGDTNLRETGNNFVTNLLTKTWSFSALKELFFQTFSWGLGILREQHDRSNLV